MVVTIELSLYPLSKSYEEPIINFIQALKSHVNIEVFTNAMSTYVRGEMSLCFSLISTELEKCFSEIDVAAVSMKIINRPLAIEQGFLDF